MGITNENEDFSDEAAFSKLQDAGFEEPDTDFEPDEEVAEPAATEPEEADADAEPEEGAEDQDTQPASKKRRPTARERIQELVGQRNEWQERYNSLQRDAEERLRQERERYERELAQYQQQQTQQQPQASADDWYADQMSDRSDPQLQQQIQNLTQQQRQVLEYVQQQRKQLEEQQRQSRQQQLVQAATSTSERYDSIPAKVLYHIISRDDKLQNPDAIDAIGRELAVSFWEWADAQGLVPKENVEPATTKDGGDGGGDTPPALKRPPSAGRRTDRDVKRGKDKNRGRRKRATNDPDPDAVLLAERLAKQHGW